LGSVAEVQGDIDTAFDVYTRCLNAARSKEIGVSAPLVMLDLAVLLLDRSDHSGAEDLFDEALRELRSEKALRQIAYGMSLSCALALPGRDNGRQKEYVRRAFAIFREIDDKYGTAVCLYWMGRLSDVEGDLSDALSHYRLSLQLRSNIDNARGICATIERIAGVSSKNGRADVAARLYGGTGQIRETLGCPVPPRMANAYESDILATCDQLGRERFLSCCAAGRAMTRPQIMDLALSGA
jgi:tetratricopeptide (TPR) repeat protein